MTKQELRNNLESFYIAYVYSTTMTETASAKKAYEIMLELIEKYGGEDDKTKIA